MVTFGCMPNSTEPRSHFAERLRELCDDMEFPERGRQTRLGKQFGVSQQAARKWLDGVTYPETEKVLAMAEWAQVNINWLLQGAGPKRGNRIDTKALVLDEAIRMLPRELGIDLIDNLRAKLERSGKVGTQEGSPGSRYAKMLEGYVQDIGRKAN